MSKEADHSNRLSKDQVKFDKSLEGRRYRLKMDAKEAKAKVIGTLSLHSEQMAARSAELDLSLAKDGKPSTDELAVYQDLFFASNALVAAVSKRLEVTPFIRSDEMHEKLEEFKSKIESFRLKVELPLFRFLLSEHHLNQQVFFHPTNNDHDLLALIDQEKIDLLTITFPNFKELIKKNFQDVRDLRKMLVMENNLYGLMGDNLDGLIEVLGHLSTMHVYTLEADGTSNDITDLITTLEGIKNENDWVKSLQMASKLTHQFNLQNRVKDILKFSNQT